MGGAQSTHEDIRRWSEKELCHHVEILGKKFVQVSKNMQVYGGFDGEVLLSLSPDEFEECLTELNVSILSKIRLRKEWRQILTDSSEKLSKRYMVGTIIDAKFGGGDVWYQGVISSHNPDGTYCITYTDGDEEDHVSSEMIRESQGSPDKPSVIKPLLANGSELEIEEVPEKEDEEQNKLVESSQDHQIVDENVIDRVVDEEDDADDDDERSGLDLLSGMGLENEEETQEDSSECTREESLRDLDIDNEDMGKSGDEGSDNEESQAAEEEEKKEEEEEEEEEEREEEGAVFNSDMARLFASCEVDARFEEAAVTNCGGDTSAYIVRAGVRCLTQSGLSIVNARKVWSRALSEAKFEDENDDVDKRVDNADEAAKVTVQDAKQEITEMNDNEDDEVTSEEDQFDRKESPSKSFVGVNNLSPVSPGSPLYENVNTGQVASSPQKPPSEEVMVDKNSPAKVVEPQVEHEGDFMGESDVVTENETSDQESEEEDRNREENAAIRARIVERYRQFLVRTGKLSLDASISDFERKVKAMIRFNDSDDDVADIDYDDDDEEEKEAEEDLVDSEDVTQQGLVEEETKREIHNNEALGCDLSGPEAGEDAIKIEEEQKEETCMDDEPQEVIEEVLFQDVTIAIDEDENDDIVTTDQEYVGLEVAVNPSMDEALEDEANDIIQEEGHESDALLDELIDDSTQQSPQGSRRLSGKEYEIVLSDSEFEYAGESEHPLSDHEEVMEKSPELFAVAEVSHVADEATDGAQIEPSGFGDEDGGDMPAVNRVSPTRSSSRSPMAMPSPLVVDNITALHISGQDLKAAGEYTRALARGHHRFINSAPLFVQELPNAPKKFLHRNSDGYWCVSEGELGLYGHHHELIALSRSELPTERGLEFSVYDKASRSMLKDLSVKIVQIAIKPEPEDEDEDDEEVLDRVNETLPSIPTPNIVSAKKEASKKASLIPYSPYSTTSSFRSVAASESDILRLNTQAPTITHGDVVVVRMSGADRFISLSNVTIKGIDEALALVVELSIRGHVDDRNRPLSLTRDCTFSDSGDWCLSSVFILGLSGWALANSLGSTLKPRIDIAVYKVESSILHLVGVTKKSLDLRRRKLGQIEPLFSKGLVDEDGLKVGEFNAQIAISAAMPALPRTQN